MAFVKPLQVWVIECVPLLLGIHTRPGFDTRTGDGEGGACFLAPLQGALAHTLVAGRRARRDGEQVAAVWMGIAQRPALAEGLARVGGDRLQRLAALTLALGLVEQSLVAAVLVELVDAAHRRALVLAALRTKLRAQCRVVAHGPVGNVLVLFGHAPS